MIKPSQTIIKLYELGGIKGMSIDYVMTGNDTAETIWNFTGVNKGRYSTRNRGWEELIKFDFDHCSMGYLKSVYVKEVEDWKAYTKKNKKELTEYKRLKAKYG